MKDYRGLSPRKGWRRFKLLFKWFFRLLFAFVFLTILLTVFYRFVPVPVTSLMVIRAVEQGWDGRTLHLKKNWASFDEISPRLQLAVIAGEDMRFYEHSGFDWQAIKKALRANRKGRRLRGGSTISQQAAKNVFLWPTRSWFRKGLEAYFTVLIELIWGKRRIMEVYLNVVEFGDGIYGAEAAAEFFFHKPAARLTSSEAALLAAVLPNPRRFQIHRPSPYVRFRQTMIQRRIPIVAQSLPSEGH